MTSSIDLKEFDVVETLIDHENIPAGSIGTIVHMFDNLIFTGKVSCIVEFDNIIIDSYLTQGYWSEELEVVTVN